MLVLITHSEISITGLMELEGDDEPIDAAAGPCKMSFLPLTYVCV